MNRVIAYLKTLQHYRQQVGWPETVGLLGAVLSVKTGNAASPQARKQLERWVFFQKLACNEKMTAVQFSLDECRVTYAARPAAERPVTLTLRIPSSVSSDSLVFEQIFLRGEYQHVLDWFASVKPAGAVARILDVGANIGCAALFFHTQVPAAEMFCLEPEPGNQARLTANLALNPGAKIKTHSAAIWTASGRLRCVHDFREGQEWAARFVELNDADQADSVAAVDIWQLAKLADFSQVDLLKMDVEGAEAVLLHDGEFKRFLTEKVSMVAMEIHPEFISFPESVAILESLGYQTRIVDEFVCGVNRNR